MDWINLPFIQGGALTVLFGAVWAVITGRLVPRHQVAEMREGDKLTIKRQEEEIKEWRTAWIAETMIKRELVTQVNDLMASGKATGELIKTLTEGQ